MKVDLLVAEIGSTTTTITAFDNLESDEPIILGQAQTPTTISKNDVNIGLMQALDNLKVKLNTSILEYDEFLATSSAAGGLKMSVHGLVYEMTVKAAKEAALGAGANIKTITSNKLDSFDLDKLRSDPPNIILVAGGVDYGENKTALYNMESILSLNLNVPIIYCGNIVNQERVAFLAKKYNADEMVVISENVYPSIDVLNVEKARNIIHDTFEKHIVKAQGMSNVRKLVKTHILPTPGAVMEAAMLLESELNDLLVIDVGGATTDIHSVSKGSAEVTKMLISPEPIAKRSVEGDLGLYVSARNIYDNLKVEEIAQQLKVSNEQVELLMKEIKPIPQSDLEIEFSKILCEYAIKTALLRHAGDYKNIYTISGSKKIAQGKDLTSIKYIILTGGALTRLPKTYILVQNIINQYNDVKLLPKDNVEILIDSEYVMANAGVIAKIMPESALKIMRRSLKCIQE